jgi:hypothetical protein
MRGRYYAFASSTPMLEATLIAKTPQRRTTQAVLLIVESSSCIHDVVRIV